MGNLPDQNKHNAEKALVSEAFFSLPFQRVFYYQVLKSASCVLPCSSVCSTSGTQEDSHVSVKNGKTSQA